MGGHIGVCMSFSVDDESQDETDGADSMSEVVRRSFLTGIATVVPLIVTVLIVNFGVGYIDSALQPLVDGLRGSPFGPNEFTDRQIKLLAVVVFLLFIFLLGLVAEFSKRGTKFGAYFDDFMSRIPGLGSVYTSFNEMSEIMLDSDTDSFQEVVFVEYPGEGSYTVAFKTAETPSVIERDTGHEDMVTLFMPMAPNPVMGGFVIHVSRDRVVDVDITVEQGLRSIVTSGVALTDSDDGPDMRGLSPDEMETLGSIERIEQHTDPGQSRAVRDENEDTAERVEEYDTEVAPEHSDTPDKIADRERTDEREETDTVPAEAAKRDSHTEETEQTPAEMADRDDTTREPTTDTPAERAGRSDDEDDRET
ncbi:DUF502 domain-containing protein [Halosegnis longus]|uniref:DUF502 domain-containing protein n=2 Tax=Halosegnis longus TaxID=2216012 RepID=A0AAJ4R9P8_9EURY|nr:DUF502 domain-containing protein [Salella cibi]